MGHTHIQQNGETPSKQLPPIVTHVQGIGAVNMDFDAGALAHHIL